jgi:poly-beta-1,6-N-acetyl-D-glucosamine synthase
MAVEILRWVVVACLAYLVLVNVMYVALILVGGFENAVRRRDRASDDVGTLAESRFTIPVSVIVPAYNEEPGISSCVRSLLELEYPEHEVIVVNDGSADGTLAALRRDFGLEPFEVFYRRIVPTEAVRAIYRSPAYPNLVVVDKDNGGKSDSLNAGLNLARYRYICGVDADTMLARDALLTTMRVVVRDPATAIGVTSHFTIARDVEAAMAEPRSERRVDPQPLVAFQHLDYLRAFFNNRLAWTRGGFMLRCAGAFMLWRRDIVEELGGFSRDFSCEDIEFTFRVHERMRRERRPYRIVCLPHNIGVTEAPDTLRNLIAQRERRQRVITETVVHYRRMLFNPRYGSVGLLGAPYYLVSELLAPVFEIAALVSLPAALVLGVFDWPVFVLMLLLMMLGNGVLSAAAVLADDRQSRMYRWRDLLRLVLIAPLDLLLYRPFMSWARLVGCWRFLRGDKGWHKFERNVRTSAARL